MLRLISASHQSPARHPRRTTHSGPGDAAKMWRISRSAFSDHPMFDPLCRLSSPRVSQLARRSLDATLWLWIGNPGAHHADTWTHGMQSKAESCMCMDCPIPALPSNTCAQPCCNKAGLTQSSSRAMAVNEDHAGYREGRLSSVPDPRVAICSIPVCPPRVRTTPLCLRMRLMRAPRWSLPLPSPGRLQ
jgi:hypothetical protein